MIDCCCICGVQTDGALCQQHATFAVLWSAVRAGKVGDWQMFHHDYMMTTDAVVGSTGDWKLQVRFILDGAA